MLHKSPSLITKHGKSLKTLIISNIIKNVAISKDLDKEGKLELMKQNSSFKYVYNIRVSTILLVSNFCFHLQIEASISTSE